MAKAQKTGTNRRARPIREIAQRELRNDISRVLAAVERGVRFRVTVRGRPVAEIVPIHRRKTWVPRDEVLEILRRAPLDENFMADVDGAVDNTIRDPWKALSAATALRGGVRVCARDRFFLRRRGVMVEFVTWPGVRERPLTVVGVAARITADLNLPEDRAAPRPRRKSKRVWVGGTA